MGSPLSLSLSLSRIFDLDFVAALLRAAFAGTASGDCPLSRLMSLHVSPCPCSGYQPTPMAVLRGCSTRLAARLPQSSGSAFGRKRTRISQESQAALKSSRPSMPSALHASK